MIKPVDKIVIVGGGSAGWMSAAALIRAYPNKDITVIESPNVPTVGVGESTLGQFRHFCHFLQIDNKDFMRHCDASFKMSIQFTDFYEKDSGSFHYPFGKPFVKDTIDGVHDWLVKKAMYPETPVRDFVHCFFPAAALFETGKYSLNKFNEFDVFNPDEDVAYHFDAIKFAIWLRDHYCKPRGVKHIQATVTDIKTNDDVGIEKLVLNTGDEVTAHLFVDCTGFRSLLIGQAMKAEFSTYDHILPNNRAWACQVPYKNKEKELEGFTNCTAIQNGWVWNTPIWSRLGTGYVYSDKFVDPENAKEEFKQYLMSDKMVIPRTRDEVESLNFRDVPMRTGVYKNSFVKNVVAIGLSAGFIEPLESNGLFSVHEFLYRLLKLLKRPAINQYDIDAYNHETSVQCTGFATFVSMHYIMSIRNDTEYWKSNFNRKVFDTPLPADIQGYKHYANAGLTKGRIHELNSGMIWISAGMNWFIYDKINLLRQEEVHKFIKKTDHHYKRIEERLRMFEMRKEKWRKNAANSPSLYYYQKKYIYEEE